MTVHREIPLESGEGLVYACRIKPLLKPLVFRGITHGTQEYLGSISLPNAGARLTFPLVW